MEITESSAPSRLLINLDFEKPFVSRTTTEFNLTPRGDSTRIDWEMRGPNILISKVMGLFANMDKLVGKDFESGLVALKSAAEQQGSTQG